MPINMISNSLDDDLAEQLGKLATPVLDPACSNDHRHASNVDRNCELLNSASGNSVAL
jgi:hypothetical protein